jgi:Protein of unknown function (DUF2680)
MELTAKQKLVGAVIAAILVAGGSAAAATYAFAGGGDSTATGAAGRFGMLPSQSENSAGPPSGMAGPAAALSGVADFLGLSSEQLQSKLQTKTLAEVAKAQGKSVADLKAAIVDLTKKQLDQAVSQGQLTEAQATQMLERIRASVDEIVNGSLPSGPPGAQGFSGPPSSGGPPSGATPDTGDGI